MRKSGHIRAGEGRKYFSFGNTPAVKRRRLRFTALAAAFLTLFLLSACSGLPDGAGALKDTVGGLIDKVRGNDGEDTAEAIGPETNGDPDDHPEPPPEEEPEAQGLAVSVDFDRQSGNSYESAVITGRSRAGESVWSYTTGQYEMAQLDRVNDVGVYGDTYYFVEDGTVTALRVADGEVLWKNADFGGSASAHAFDGDGNVYLCGYFGPDLFIVGPGGATVKSIDAFDSDYYWPWRLDYQGTQLAITFEGTPSGNDETVYVSLDDYSTSINKTGGAPSGSAANVSMSAVSGTSASSYLVEPQYGISHGPELVIDGSLSTGWVENVPGQGIGESVTLSLDGVYRVSGFTINAGYQKSSSLYYKNSRPASLLVTFSDGSSVRLDLEDYFGQQTFTFDRPVETTSVTFTIESVYAGNKYQDTVISEISLF